VFVPHVILVGVALYIYVLSFMPFVVVVVVVVVVENVVVLYLCL
jgi:hypothetical protein